MGLICTGVEHEAVWTGYHVLKSERQRFRTKKDRSPDLCSVLHECPPGRRKLAANAVDVFGNDTVTIVEVRV